MRSTSARSRRPASPVVSVVVIAALALAVAACSDDDAAPPGGSDPAPASSAAAPTAPASTSAETQPGATGGSTVASEPAGTSGSTAPVGPTGPACAEYPAEGPGSPDTMSTGSTAAAIAGNPNLSTVATAIDAAGLAETLDGPGPVTVFAPSDDAFGEIAPDELEALLADPEGALTALLSRHLVDGAALTIASLVEVGSIAGVGGTLAVAPDDDVLLVDAGGGPAQIVCGDITTTNGVIHIIDAALLPPPVDTQAVGGSQLFTVDLATGAASPIGGFGAERGVLGITVAPDETTVYGITDAAELISFSPDDPAGATAVAITGVEGSTLLALDIDRNGGALLAMSDANVLYAVDAATGVATPIGAPLDPGIDDPGFGFDIDPSTGSARVLVATGTNLDVDAATGVATSDVATTARIVAAAFDASEGGEPALYVIDAATGSLGRLDVPADGVVTTIGELGVILTDGASLDISASGVAYLAVPG